jgi:hypothetical protein
MILESKTSERSNALADPQNKLFRHFSTAGTKITPERRVRGVDSLVLVNLRLETADVQDERVKVRS